MAFLALLFVILLAAFAVEVLMSEQQPSVTCPDCGRTSYHPQDIAEGYCSNCHDWTSRRTPDTKRTPRGENK